MEIEKLSKIIENQQGLEFWFILSVLRIGNWFLRLKRPWKRQIL